jgi:phosphoglycerol transferase
VTPAAVRPYAAVKTAFASDADLVRRIEAVVPRDAMIFELPYHSYPEAGAQNGMLDYDALRPYLHSRTLRWSYPTMRNRFDDIWIRQIAGQEPARLVGELSDADFEGILVDRAGYADNAAEVEAALGRLLGLIPEVSTDNRLAFFPLTTYKQRAHADDSAGEREHRRDKALHPLLVRWGTGFWYPETAPQGTFRWCSHSGEIGIENGSQTSKWASITLKAFAAQPPSHLLVEGDLLSERVDLPPAGVLFLRTFKVPPGDHVIRFRSDGRPLDAPHDPRSLVWVAENTVVVEAEWPAGE